jgi:hypothetical protein
LDKLTDSVSIPDRRRSVRISPKGTLLLFAGEHAQRARVTNIGLGGCLATSTIPVPRKLLDRAVDLELRLDGQHSTWLRLTGHVLRVDANTLALRFDTAPPDFARAIDQMSSASYRHDRTLSVMLVDATSERRLPMAEAFRAAGCTVLDVNTPLEAIVRLGESAFEPDVIAVADSLPSSDSDELRRFVELAHPGAQLVAIGNDVTSPSGIVNWLSSANPNDDLAARIREMLVRSS